MEDYTKLGKILQLDELDETNNIEDLVQRVQLFMDASRSKGTKKAYQADWKSFTRFCEALQLEAIPATPKTICEYITWLAEKGLKVSTISRHLTTISQAHFAFKRSSPTTDYDVIRTFQGIKRTIGTKKKRAKPLLWTEMQTIVESTRSSAIGKRDRALLLVGWAAALRRSEIVALDRKDIEFVSEGMIVTITSSKTDQEGEVWRIGIPFAKTSGIGICPVVCMREHISRCKIETGPLFFVMGTAGKAFYTVDKEKKRLSDRSVNMILKRRMKSAGLDNEGFSGHSLRAGYITSAAKAHVPENLIQLHTRHVSAKVMREYILEGSLFNDNPLDSIY